MKKELLSKNGLAISRIAREFILLKVGDRIDTIREYAARFGFGTGTIQTALKVLAEGKAVELESRGHLGTYIAYIDYHELWDIAGLGSITGVMPLPYSKRYEGLATGFYKAFEGAGIPFNMAYMRGASRRLEGLEKGKYDFAIMSKLAADKIIESGGALEIVFDLGKYSYVGGHKVLISKPKYKEIKSGMKVALDKNSLDQYLLTYYECEGKQVTFEEIPYNQILKKLLDKSIDAAIWNIDEIEERNLNIPYYDMKNQKISEINEDDTRAVVVVKKYNGDFGNILKKFIDPKDILNIQQKVIKGEILPSY